jgi:hypothetical protein
MKTRLEAFALAAVLAVTVITGGIAFAGMRHGTAAPAAAAPAIAQIVPAATAPPQERDS